MSSLIDVALDQLAPPSAAETERLPLVRRIRSDRLLMAGIVLLVLMLLLAFVVPLLLPPSDEIHPDAVLEGPSAGHLLGSDPFGRDLFSRLAEGMRTSLILGLASVTGAALVGVPIGLVAGLQGGWLDATLMRMLDALLAFPVLLMSLFVVVALGPSTLHLAIAIAFVFIPYFARLTRSEARELRSAAFVEAATCYGTPGWRTMFGVVLPNASGPIAVQLSLSVGVAILAEASLSFLGLGVQPPSAALGLMLNDSQIYLGNFPWYSLVTGLAIVMLVLTFVLLGDGIRDVLSPRRAEER